MFCLCMHHAPLSDLACQTRAVPSACQSNSPRVCVANATELEWCAVEGVALHGAVHADPRILQCIVEYTTVEGNIMSNYIMACGI